MQGMAFEITNKVNKTQYAFSIIRCRTRIAKTTVSTPLALAEEHAPWKVKRSAVAVALHYLTFKMATPYLHIT